MNKQKRIWTIFVSCNLKLAKGGDPNFVVLIYMILNVWIFKNVSGFPLDPPQFQGSVGW